MQVTTTQMLRPTFFTFLSDVRIQSYIYLLEYVDSCYMLIFHICRKKSTNSYPYSSSGWGLHGSVARSRRASNPAAHHHNHRADNQEMLFQSLEEDMKLISNCTFFTSGVKFREDDIL